MIELSKIRIDGGTQTRESLNNDTVKEYAESYKAGAKFPPVSLFFDGSDYWLADGFHRYHGARQAKLKQIHEEVTPGTVRDAILYSLGANTTHGLKRSNKDKHRAVETLLSDEEWATWSSNQIALKCCVSNDLVDKIRQSYLAKKQDSAPEKRKATRNGTTYTQDTTNVGKGKKSDEKKPEDPPKEPEYTALDEAQDRVSELQGALFVAAQGELPEEQKQAALNLVDSLRQEIKTKDATIKALTISRDGFQNQVAQLKKQCEMQRKEIAKLRAG